MSVVIETTLGDITVDLFLDERPRACLNFLKLCKIKYYNFSLFHTISRGFIAQTGDPTGTRSGGESIFAVIDGPSKKYFEAENEPRIKHTRPGLISFVGSTNNMIASQFFVTLGEDLTYLDEKHCVFGELVEGLEILETINEVICDNDDRPFQDVRITHTVVLDDPYPDPKGLRIPSRSPSPSVERLAGGRIAPDEEIDEMSGKSAKEISEMQAEREAQARATILEMVGDIPDADMAPPENVLFVCKLNPITQDDDLEILFSRFGKIKSCEVIRDRKTGDSLQYAFIEFEDQKSCEDAYFKMDNVLVDDRRLHVDFSQSVSKVKWLGKGRGVINFDDKGNTRKADINNDIGKGEYKMKNGSRRKNIDRERNRPQSRSPMRDRAKSRSPRKKILSPEKSGRKSNSPQANRRQSRSPKRQGGRSGTPIKRSNSPARRRKYNRSPDYSPRRNDRKLSPRRKPRLAESSQGGLRRNIERYSSERKAGYSRRSSPWSNRRDNLNRRRSRSPIQKSRSPTRKSRSPARKLSSPGERSRPTREKTDRYSLDERLIKDKQSSLPIKSGLPKTGRKKQSESPRSKSTKGRSRSPKERFEPRREEKRLPKAKRQNSGSSRESSESPKRTRPTSTSKNLEKPQVRYRISESKDKSKDQRHVKERSGADISSEKAKKKDYQKSNIKVKKGKTRSNKKKKSKNYDSSDESETSDSEEERKKFKKKKSKRKVESSTESSSSEESSSSSSEEKAMKKAKKQNRKKDKKRKSKKTKTKNYSSSDSSSDSPSDSSSDSESNSSSSSSSESDKYKKKKLKKKRTKSSSVSE